MEDFESINLHLKLTLEELEVKFFFLQHVERIRKFQLPNESHLLCNLLTATLRCKSSLLYNRIID